MVPASVFSSLCVIVLSSILFTTAYSDKHSSVSYKDDTTCPAAKKCLHERDANNVSACPVWYYCDKSNTCKCGHEYHSIIKCNQLLQKVKILDCYCITYDEDAKEVVAGHCLTNCGTPEKGDLVDLVYHSVEPNVADLNKNVCNVTNRDGPLCGRCRETYYPLAYSYNHTCIKCPERGGKWWKFILAAYGPLTLFYLFVLFFRLNITSSSFHAYVLFSQGLTMPANVRVLLSTTSSNPHMSLGVKILISFYGIWNLDFFRSFYSDICLKVDSTTVLLLEYTIALYPLVLTIISFQCIKFYERRQCRLAVLIWRPIKSVLELFHSNWDSRTSVIDAYTTFFTLAYTKVLCASADLLIPTALYSPNSDNHRLALYFDGSKAYFKGEHAPYAVVALFVFATFNVLPLLTLLFYQFAWFQRLLNHLPIQLHILHTFMDLFQGHYKNGTEPGTRDCRWFSSQYLFIRMVLFLIFAYTLNGTFFIFSAMALMIFLLALISVKPYKKSSQLVSDVVYIVFILLLYITILAINLAAVSRIHSTLFFSYFLGIVIGTFPAISMTIYGIYWIISRRQFGLMFVTMLMEKVKMWHSSSSDERDSLLDND